jgi:hypothetical protein
MQYENIRVTLEIQDGEEEDVDEFSRITGLDHALILADSETRLNAFPVDVNDNVPGIKNTTFVEKCTASLFIQALDVDGHGSTRVRPGCRGELKAVIADFLLGGFFDGCIDKNLWIGRVFNGIELVKRDWVVC